MPDATMLSDETSPLLIQSSPEKKERFSYIGSIFSAIAGILLLFYLYRLLIAYESGISCPIYKYDYDILALRWTPSFCASKECVNSTENWEIHGLWPSWSNGSEGPENCCPAWDFSENELKTLLPQLSVDWPNQIPNRSQNSLWQHEWAKHGTCSVLTSSGMFNYFNTTLALFHRYPIQSWLTEAGIKPTPIKSKYGYTLDQIHAAIETKIDAKISIHCIKSHEKIPLLDTIYLCFKSPFMELISCPPDHCYSAEKVVLPQVIKPAQANNLSLI